MSYFPFFIDLKDKEVLVVGGGKVAYRKIKTLLDFEAKITVISETYVDEVFELVKVFNIILFEKTFEKIDIENNNFFCVISATDNEDVNSSISKICFDRNILVNVADDIDKCNFTFPAVVKKDDIIIGISTSGKSPTMSKVIKGNIVDMMPKFYGDLVNKLGLAREKIKIQVQDEKKRKLILHKLTDVGLEKNGDINQQDIEDIILNIDKRGN